MSTEVCISCSTCITCITCVRCIAVLVRASQEELCGERLFFPTWSLDDALGTTPGCICSQRVNKYLASTKGGDTCIVLWRDLYHIEPNQLDTTPDHIKHRQ